MDILDLVLSTAEVAVEGGTLTVRGLSNRTVFALFEKYPKLLSLLLGGGIDIVALITATPDASLTSMAAGLGVAGDAERTAKLDALPLESQAAIVEKILERTCPGGVGPFVSRIAALLTPRKAEPEPAAAEEEIGGALTPLVPPEISPAPSS